MFSQMPEARLHWIRWILAIAWLLMIASLFHDPWTSALTNPNLPWSLLWSTHRCVPVQNECLTTSPYPLGTTLLWSIIVPASIFILLVFGHELWRRICPLSFLSQIPRALGRQRHVKRENKQTGKVRYELVKVDSDSWLGRNYPYVQFGWLFVGLCGRILFFNSDRTLLAGWLIFTIATAITIGYLYEGKSWCQYFCPMAPVQSIFSEPGGLLGSQAHLSDQPITQSMCRTVLPDGEEHSTCVACQNPCIDIDAERTYWENFNKPTTAFTRYGYIGLALGFFGYSYLYAGNWDYYFSGIWLQPGHQLVSLFHPGLYLFGQPVHIPKLVAVPLVLGICTALGVWSGRGLERWAKTYSQQYWPKLTMPTIRHRLFTLGTFGIFNVIFIFAGHPVVQLLPLPVAKLYNVSLVVLSTLWLTKTWQRSPDLYTRENLASRFRKQLEKLELNVTEYLEGRALSDLNSYEVYVLAKVLPGFNRENRYEAYKGVVQEVLEEGYVNYSSSLDMLQHMRQELSITDEDHRQILEELGIEDPELLNPTRQRSLENQIRLSGFRKSLERLMRLQSKQPEFVAFEDLSPQQLAQIRTLRRQYSITPQEEEWILSGFSAQTNSIKKAEFLLNQLPELVDCYCAFNQPILQRYQAVLTVLNENIAHKKELMVRAILDTLATLQADPLAPAIAARLQQVSPQILLDLLERENWDTRLPPEIVKILTQPGETPTSCALEISVPDILRHLEALIADHNPLIKMAALYMIAQLDWERGQAIAQNLRSSAPLSVKETAEVLLSSPNLNLPLSAFPTLEKLVYLLNSDFLMNSDFFRRMQSETLLTLANRAKVTTYASGDVITAAGDTCRELLLLMEGSAKVHYQTGTTTRLEDLYPGHVLDELEVFANSTSESTIIAESEKTRILSISVDSFDDLLNQDPDLARRVLELEHRQIQRFVQSVHPL